MISLDQPIQVTTMLQKEKKDVNREKSNKDNKLLLTKLLLTKLLLTKLLPIKLLLTKQKENKQSWMLFNNKRKLMQKRRDLKILQLNRKHRENLMNIMLI